MNDDYDAVLKAQDAVAFANSRFGKHFIESRLPSIRDAHYDKARNLQRSGGDLALIAAEIARADTIDGEIEYFRVAQQIVTEPGLIARIRENIRKKEDKTK